MTPSSTALGIGLGKLNEVSRKPALPRELARRDVEAAVDYYGRVAGPDVALGFIEALQSAFRAIAEQPALGSPRYAQELALPELRSFAVKGFRISCLTSNAATTSISGECSTAGATCLRACEKPEP